MAIQLPRSNLLSQKSRTKADVRRNDKAFVVVHKTNIKHLKYRKGDYRILGRCKAVELLRELWTGLFSRTYRILATWSFVNIFMQESSV
ncbi:hypothetical protein FUAX_36530 [Fulvitalea axinellae]|uniref:Uncharacterized protein n=1 Tax=Fulvitalea axinellae TaxID=1182444 RepID=A0AAU9CPZ4_9BACT|nr:hypothetical protein FUAX_36530 [Fulvitalea axinellae]